MTRKQLVDIVSHKAHMPKKQVRQVLDHSFNEIKQAIYKGENVTLTNFGTFYTSRQKSKRVVPFGAKAASFMQKPYTRVVFRACRAWKQRMKGL